MLETFSLETFVNHVGEEFLVTPAEGEPVTVRLVEATSLGPAPHAGGRAPFSLIFGDSPRAVLPQGIHAMRHETIGAFELFIVPLQPDRSGPLFQAVFN